MTQRLPSSLLLGCAALLLFATAAQAQVVRPNSTLFIGLRGGLTAYGGELDQTGSVANPGDPEGDYAWLFSDLGFGGGLELGYQFSSSFGFGINALYGRYSNINEGPVYNPTTGQISQAPLNDSESFIQVHPLFRFMPFPGARFTPYVEFGGGFAYYTGGDRPSDASNTAYGPSIGGGFDLLAGRQLSLYIGALGSLWFPDDGFDFSDPDANTQFSNSPAVLDDEADFDATILYNIGLRYFFRAPYTNVDATIDCATELTVGESGSFTAYVNENASEPLSFEWNWGDGATSPGLTASHAYSAPGTYTVSFTATGPANSDTETCLVTVVEPQIPPSLASCRVSPSRVDAGNQVTVSATVSGSEPFDITVDFGDGNTADSLPATHTYDEVGTYTVTITATNAYGSDTCTVTVTVGDSFCDEVTELNTVYFDYEMSALTAEARSRLDENIEVLRRCPDICVVINAYADDRERDKLRLSERRAEEVKAYYVANGIDESRILARGLGEAPDSNSKEDPGPGDRNARRAESIPVDCDRLDDMN